MWHLAAVAAVVASALVAPAVAQQLTLEPSAAITCLTPAQSERSTPEYPFDAYKRGEKGRVKVVLKFTGPGLRPAVRVLEQEGDQAFVEAVEDHVRAYRVPCHAGGETPVELVFEFVFRPDNRSVHWARPVDLADADRMLLLGCLVHNSGGREPSYPDSALRNLMQARVLARLRFDAADKPPTVEVFARAGQDAPLRERRRTDPFVLTIEGWASGYRMPCHAGQTVSTVVTFIFKIEDAGEFGFKPGLTLTSLLPVVRGIRQQRLNFDTSSMACPFDVRLAYRRPHMANLVGEIGNQDPARRPLLDWLAQLELDLPAASLDSIYGDTTTVTVPCFKIDHNPQE